jgi:hypothetical protein
VELWKRRTKATKREEREEGEEQHEEQLEEVSLLQSRPCKPTMVVEVCCHCHELSIAVTSPLSSVFIFRIIFFIVFFAFSYYSCFFLVFFIPFFSGISKNLTFFFLSFSFFPVFIYFIIGNF